METKNSYSEFVDKINYLDRLKVHATDPEQEKLTELQDQIIALIIPIINRRDDECIECGKRLVNRITREDGSVDVIKVCPDEECPSNNIDAGCPRCGGLYCGCK